MLYELNQIISYCIFYVILFGLIVERNGIPIGSKVNSLTEFMVFEVK